jgi:hypothetical protein
MMCKKRISKGTEVKGELSTVSMSSYLFHALTIPYTVMVRSQLDLSIVVPSKFLQITRRRRLYRVYKKTRAAIGAYISQTFPSMSRTHFSSL